MTSSAAPSPSPAARTCTAALDAVLQGLVLAAGFERWLVTRVQGERWRVVATAATAAAAVALDRGATAAWSETLCARLVARGSDPDVCADLATSLRYADAPARAQLGLAAYAGAAVRLADGTLFGTVCAMGRNPLAAEAATIAGVHPLMATAAAAVAAVADSARQLFAYERAELARTLPAAARCPSTGLASAPAWAAAGSQEAQRADALGLATAAVVVEVSQPMLPDAADARAAWVLATKRAAAIVPLACRKSDLAAHLAPGRIAVLLVECDEAGAQLLVARLRARLFDAGVAARIGLATTHEADDIGALSERALERARADAGTRTRAGAGLDARLPADAAQLLAAFAGCRVSMTSVASAGGLAPERALAALGQLKALGLARIELGSGTSAVVFADRRRALAAPG